MLLSVIWTPLVGFAQGSDMNGYIARGILATVWKRRVDCRQTRGDRETGRRLEQLYSGEMMVSSAGVRGGQGQCKPSLRDTHTGQH